MTIYADASEGPAITTIEYGIDPKTAEEFLQTTRNEADPPACRRDWLEASARLRRPQRYVEIFVTES
ncbi:MAG: hypothetical protein QOF72_836 [Blastocatellia bacterium]|jgi:hypothetical protein|nr:hypothetical protein [Blastocatellia bacterium]